MEKIKSFFINKNIVSNLYYPLVILGYVLTLFTSKMRPGVWATLLMLLLIGVLILKKSFKPGSVCDYLVIAFFVYELISVIWLKQGGFPLSVFASEFVASSLPMVFYFVGKTSGKKTGRWYMFYLYAMLIVGTLGAILYFSAPQFYNDWSYSVGFISKANAQTTRVRMQSVVGSTSLSFIMVAGMLAASYFLGDFEGIKDDADDSGSKMIKKRRMILGTACLFLCLLFAILANQRSGLVAAALVIIYVNYLIFFQLNLIPRKYFIWEIAAVAAVFTAIGVIRFDFLLKYWYRLISLPTAISQRSEQWVAAVNNMYSTWLGNGLGANGHKAIGIEGAHIIADGGLVKLYCENGVLGFSIWLYLLILTIGKGAKNIRHYYAEIGIIMVGLLQSIGSNMLAFQLCTPIFWFAVGRINEKD